jgi:carboxypeptidase Taq
MTAFAELSAIRAKAATLSSIAQLLGWDQETYMPPGGSAIRAEQASMLAELTHKASTDPRLGELITACEADRSVTSDPRAAAALREIRRDYDLATRLPSDLVAELARVGSEAQQVWKAAREKSDFAMFAPYLEKMFALTRRRAECLLPALPKGSELYDALLDEYEPGISAAEVDATFKPLRERLAALIARVASCGKKVDDSILHLRIDPAKQHAFGMFVLEAIGFDLNAGRLDTTSHPFCQGLGPGDTRLTTRYRDQHFSDALYSTLHEAGHGIYDQGLPKSGKLRVAGADVPLWGSPLSDAISLGIHESQSRMWENLVGRSREFWEWALPHANRFFDNALKGATPDTMFNAVNTTVPSFIRVESDEGTYNLHIMLRFEMERALLRGDIKVADVPHEWNKRFKNYLGLDVPDDRRGCLQDVHWSFGLIGYFPTYTLGNLYSCQFWETIREQIPNLGARIAKGDFSALKTWLNTNIHAPGKQHRAADLCKLVTGKPLSADPLMRHLESKAKAVYGV